MLLLVLLMPAPPRVLVCTCELEPSVLVETLVLLPESLCVWQPQTSAAAANIANKVFIESNVLRLWRDPYRENCCPKRASDPSARLGGRVLMAGAARCRDGLLSEPF